MDATSWDPKVLTEYEIGRCMSAIDDVGMLNKPIAEVMTRTAGIYDLQDDLTKCLELSGRVGSDIRYWIRPSGQRLRYGFYRHLWALQALEFLDRGELSQFDRDWISGLLFGYAPERIQEFVDKQKAGM